MQKELCALHRYVDSIIKSDTILQQRFHCLGAGLTKDKVTIDFLDIPEDSFEVFKSAFKKNVFASPLLEFNIMSDITFGPEIIPIKEDSLGRTANNSVKSYTTGYSPRRSHKPCFPFNAC